MTVLDSYLENCIKESERSRRLTDIESVGFENLLLYSTTSVKLDWCWASWNSKEYLHILSLGSFKQKANEEGVCIVLSGYATNGTETNDLIMLKDGTLIPEKS